nr:septum site-determining protein Ssd [Kocuria varians]
MTSAHTPDPGALLTDPPRRVRRATTDASADGFPPAAQRVVATRDVGAQHAEGSHGTAPRRRTGGSSTPGYAGSAPSPGRGGPGRARGVRLVSSSPELREAVEAVCIGVGVPLTVADDAAGAGASSSDLLLVDAAVGGQAVPRGAVVVALADQPEAWETAARHAASAVVVLPHAAAWLAELISRSATPEVAVALGRVYGVVGATGGVGATTLACWLAAHVAAAGTATALIDGDPLGAGVDLALGEEAVDGLRWPELNQFSGAVAADQLWTAMPRVDELRYLSWDRHGSHATTVPAATVVAALRGAAAVQVVDLSRADLERQARWCDAVVVVTPRTVRGVLAAEHTARRCGAVPAVTVLAGVDVADLEPRVLAESVGVPCVATIAFDPRVPEHLDAGTVLRRARRPRHAKALAAILRAVEGL